MPEPDNQDPEAESPAKPGDVAHPADGETANQAQPTLSNDHEDMPRRSKLWVILAVILVVLAAAAGGYYYWQHHKAKPKVQAPTKKDIALLKVGLSDSEGGTFYPKAPSNAGDIEVQNQIFEGLIGYQNGTKLVPLLAASWTNPDDTNWIFTLRQGVKFHNGHTMTADDVKYSLDNFKDVAYSDSNDYGTTIKTVTVVAPDKVKITTDGPDPTLLGKLAYLAIIDAHNTKPDDPANGTGPYTQKTGTADKTDVMDLVAFDGYWGGHVYTRELQFSFSKSTDEAIDPLKNHQLDMYGDFSKTADLATLKQAGIVTTPVPGSTVHLFLLNTKLPKSPLANLKFRQGINLALDHQALTDASGAEGTAINQLVPISIPGYDRSLTVTKPDLTQAKTLIAASGIKNPTITLSYVSAQEALAKETQKELAAVGVTVKLDPATDTGTFYDQLYAGKQELSYFGTASSVLDASDVFEQFKSQPFYDSATFNDDLAAANQTIDATKHIALLQKAAQQLNLDLVVIPVATTNYFSATSLSGVHMTPEVPNVNIGAYFWKVYQQ